MPYCNSVASSLNCSLFMALCIFTYYRHYTLLLSKRKNHRRHKCMGAIKHDTSSSPSLHQQCLHLEADTMRQKSYGASSCLLCCGASLEVRRAAVPTFNQRLTVWSVEPVMTHHTPRHESIGEYQKRQHQAGEVSAPRRASCPAAGSLGQMMTSAALRQHVFTLENQAAHLLP